MSSESHQKKDFDTHKKEVKETWAHWSDNLSENKLNALMSESDPIVRSFLPKPTSKFVKHRSTKLK